MIGALPQMRLHKPSGQGRVRIGGRDFFVGRFGTPEAGSRYMALLTQHGFLLPAAAAGRGPGAARSAAAPQIEPARLPAAGEPLPAGLTVAEVARMYLGEIEATAAGGSRSCRYAKALAAVRAVRPLATMAAEEFGPRALLDVRRQLVATPAANRRPGSDGRVPTLCRRYVNEVVGHVRRMFDWAGRQELVPADRVLALKLVKGLRKGDDATARETRRRKPVRPSVVRATLPYMSAEVADLIWFVRLTGCRPSEAARMKPCRIFDRDKPVWRYVPRKHKTAHKGKSRHVPIGPQAQEIVEAHTAGRGDRDYVFTPQRSVPARRTRDGVLEMVPRKPAAHARAAFTKDGIVQAVRRAIARANRVRAEHGEPPLPHWTPYQLRYTRLREIRRAGGREAAQATAGHSRETMTDHYAPADWNKAARAALRTG
jgi:integrase